MIPSDDLPVRRKSWVALANVPANRRGWEFSDCTDVTEKDLKMLSKWVEHVKNGNVIRAEGKPYCGKGLMLVGAPGHGKTTLSVALLQEIMTTFPIEPFKVEEGKVLNRPCYFATFNDILNLKGLTIENSASEAQVTL